MRVTCNPEFDLLRVERGGFAMPVGHHRIVVVARIQHPGQKQLPLIVDALDAPRLGFPFGQHRQQQRRKNSDDGNDHQQFRQCKPGPARHRVALAAGP